MISFSRKPANWNPIHLNKILGEAVLLLAGSISQQQNTNKIDNTNNSNNNTNPKTNNYKEILERIELYLILGANPDHLYKERRPLHIAAGMNAIINC